MLSKVQNMGSGKKLFLAISHDFFMSFLALFLAYTLRYDQFEISPQTEQLFLKLFLLTPFLQVPIFYLMGVYKGVWRYSSIPDLVKVSKSAFFSTVTLYGFIYFLFRLDHIPRSIPILQIILLIFFMGGGRFLYRIARDREDYNEAQIGRKRVIIVGAGSGGEQLFRDIRKNPAMNLQVIGFIDDSLSLKRRAIHGVPILGTSEEIPGIMNKFKPNNVFIAIPSADSKTIRRFYNALKEYQVEIKTLPSLNELLISNFNMQNLEKISIEDLLGRDEIDIDFQTVSHKIEDEIVLVTGAGGSIGSELCRQLSFFKPKKLIAFDISEYNCFKLNQSLKKKFPDLEIRTIVGDVREFDTIFSLIEREKPSVVFHAAAYKHVPLMEFNPYEACKTNIIGTENVVVSCIQNRIERFVLVSTDKAVNPTNIMGTTKRVAELVVQNFGNKSTYTKLMTVRFGNVLGSSGSVIPIFREQIKNGGPVTVTHKDITRYFMSIPEASRLVIQAGIMGGGGEIFVLDMGSPVKILDLAKEMISLAGLQENVDIKINITGLRPGEKLYEEPLMDQETLIGTDHPKVLVSKARPVPANFSDQIEQLKGLSTNSERNEYLKILNFVVPEYKPFITTEESKPGKATFQ